MAKHTPGPWKLGRRSVHRVRITADGWAEFAKVVVKMRGSEVDMEEGHANALLIAAAPELLAALQAVSDFVPNRPDDVWRQVSAALFRAEGK